MPSLEKRRAKREQREARRQVKSERLRANQEILEHVTPKREALSAKNEEQGHYLISIQSRTLTFGLGPAGTGKTYLAVMSAADALIEGRVQKIILTRPAVEAADEHMGFLPGDLSEKFGPYLGPVIEYLEERLGAAQVARLIREGKIEGRPLAYMRGSTFKDAFVILDEAQNCTPRAMEMFLTRIGNYCTVVVNGDLRQSDIEGMNGLEDGIRVLQRRGVKGVGYCPLTTVVRSGLAQAIVEAYEAA